MQRAEATPTRIGRYQVQALIGRGGMARVYRALDPYRGCVVAVKVMNPELSYGSGVQRFIKSARVLARLRNPYIIELYDIGEEHGTPYLAMEYVDGVSLDRYLGNGQVLPLPQVVRVMEQIGEALDYAHRRRIIHRDLKPSNILVTRDWRRAVLTDFGLARALYEAHITMPGIPLGTPRYMAPELVRGANATEASDIFALAVTCYELLTGRPAFDGSMVEVAAQIVAGRVRPASQVNPRLPAHVDDVLQRGMHPNPAQRYTSAMHFAQSLRAALGLSRPTPTPGPRRPVQKSRRPAGVRFAPGSPATLSRGLWIAVIIVIAIVALTILFSIQFGG